MCHIYEKMCNICENHMKHLYTISYVVKVVVFGDM